MTTFHIDATAQQLRATGIVEPHRDWIEDPETRRRRPSEQQAVNADGLPLWSLEVQYVAEQWGRQATTVSRLIVPSKTTPAVAMFEVIGAQGLRVNVRATKAGQLVEVWEADALTTPAKAAA